MAEDMTPQRIAEIDEALSHIDIFRVKRGYWCKSDLCACLGCVNRHANGLEAQGVTEDEYRAYQKATDPSAQGGRDGSEQGGTP